MNMKITSRDWLIRTLDLDPAIGSTTLLKDFSSQGRAYFSRMTLIFETGGGEQEPTQGAASSRSCCPPLPIRLEQVDLFKCRIGLRSCFAGVRTMSRE
jgi:hypothetical protein